MLDDDDDGSRQEYEDRARLEFWRVNGRDGEPRGAFDGREVDDARCIGDDVTRNDADEDGDDGEEAAKRDGGEDRDGERGDRDEDDGRIRLGIGQTCHLRCRRHELKSDDGDDRAHRGGREDHVDPARADGMDDEAHEAEDDAYDDEAAERRLVAVVGEHEEYGREKGEA